MLRGGWFGIVLRRAGADRALVAASALVVLAASAVLVAASAYPALAAREGAATRLAAADALATAISVTIDVRPADGAGADERVRAVLDEALGPARGRLLVSGLSESWDPGLAGGDAPLLTKLAFLDGLDQHARLIAGAWPREGRPEIEAVLGSAAADRLGVAPGSLITATSRLDPARRIEVRVVGVVALDPEDPAWGGDPLALDGVEQAGRFTTLGPLLVARADLLERAVVRSATLTWRAFPGFAGLDPAGIPALAAAADRVDDRLRSALGGSRSIRVETDLPAILRAADAAVAQATTGSGVIGGQLLVLAVYALVFVASLVVERRRGSTSLLQARGARTPHLLRLAGMEAALIALPTAALGVPLGLALVGLLAWLALPPGAGASLALSGPILAVAGGTSLVAIAGMVAPVVVSVGSVARLRRSAAGRRSAALVSRSGLDLALVVLAGIGLWQLRAAAAAPRHGPRAFDAVDLAAPALGLVAGALLAIRLTPVAARLLERAMTRGVAAAGALAGRGIARRAGSHARPVVLLVAATGIAVYCVEFDRTWADSQRDQVAHELAADVRGIPAGQGGTPLQAGRAYRSLAGVTAASPVGRDTLDLGGSVSLGQLLAIPADAALAERAWRADQSGRPAGELLAGLAAARPALPMLTLPASTGRVRVTMDADLVPASGTAPIPAGWNGLALALVVQDGSGALSRLPAAAAGDRGSPFVVDLGSDQAAAADAAAPLAIVAIELEVTPPLGPGLAGSVGLAGVEVSGGPAGQGWRPVDLEPALAGWGSARTAFGTAAEPLAADPDRPGHALIAAEDPLSGVGATTLAFRPAALAEIAASPFAALLDGRALGATPGAAAGDTILARRGFAETRRLRVAGVVASVPGVAGDGAVVVDLGTLQLVEYGASGAVPPPAEWWLATDGSDDASIVRALEAGPYPLEAVRSRRIESDARLDDPIALGLLGALGLAGATAVTLATIGLAAASWAARRTRRGEYAVLRALGLPRRDLATWLVAEQAFPIIAGLAGGALLGAVLGAVVLPVTTRAPDGSPPVPPALVQPPWDLFVALGIAGATALAVAGATGLRSARAAGVAETLRNDPPGSDA